MATFLFIFAFSTFIFSEISGFDSFVYKNAPPEMIKAAKQIGQNERLSFIQELQNRKHSDEEKINLYSNHLSACSSVANELSEKLAATLGEEAKKPIELSESRTTKQVLSAIGIDAVSVALMTMPMSEMAETIHAACLKNELQFQCAFGFIEDRDKILAHILAMTENDGNVKMMFDVECKRPELAPLTYACIGDNAQKLMAECGTSIGAYNDTRTEVNIRMGLTYADVMTVIENSMNRAASEAELVKLMAESNDLMAATLRGLSRLEAFKCRSYYQMERCLSKAVNKFCGVDSVNALTTILRVGYLRRERGEDLHNQFLESQVPPTKACSKTFNS